MENLDNRTIAQTFSYWRKRTFITLWITYGSFYLCRMNMSIALPGIMQEFGCSKTDIGTIGSIFFIAYGIGQFINGQLGDKLGARKLVTTGIIISAILNIFFGFSTSLVFMMVIWGLNGYFQSMGWSPTVKVLANWFPVTSRGKISGIYSTSYQIGNVYSWLLAGYVAVHLGWRYVFWVPGILFIVSGIHFFARVRNSPEDIGLPTIEEYEKHGNFELKERSPIANKDHHLGFGYTLKQTVGNWRMWCAGLASLCISIAAYGFLYWIHTYMYETGKISVSQSAMKSLLFPFAGSLGAVTSGWITDKFFASRRAPVVVIMAGLSSVSILIYSQISVSNSLLNMIFLAVIGFLIFGPCSMGCSIAMDFGTRKAAASSAGFIDALAYVGAAITGVGTGWLVDKFDWNFAFYFWAISIFISALLMTSLWNYKPEKAKYH